MNNQTQTKASAAGTAQKQQRWDDPALWAGVQTGTCTKCSKAAQVLRNGICFICECPPKVALFKTASAILSCAHFKSGEFVSVQYSHTTNGGVNWFLIHRSERGELERPVAYPEHHLENFCL